MSASLRTGFIGLGKMGGPMAMRLVSAQVPLVVWNRTADRANPLVEAGATAAPSLQDVGAQCSIVFLCVSDGPDVEELLLGPQGVVQGAAAGTLIVDCSTVSPALSRSLAATLERKGLAFVDAPVSGGVEGAQRGTLSILVGGAPADFERARPLLERMGKKVTHLGPVGAGQTAKLVNQIIVVGNTLAMSEGILFAQAAGLDVAQTLRAIEAGAAGSWMLSNRGPQIANGDFRPGFTIDLQQKDLRLVLAEADAMGLPLQATQWISQLYRVLQKDGLGHEGNHGLIKALARLAGIDLTLR